VGKEKDVEERLEKIGNDFYTPRTFSRLVEGRIDVGENQSWKDEKGKERKEFSLIMTEVTGGYGLPKEFPAEVAAEMNDEDDNLLIEEGKLFMKEVEPGSGSYPADTFADLVKRVRKDRSSELFEEVF
jgi:hypothetical protein